MESPKNTNHKSLSIKPWGAIRPCSSGILDLLTAKAGEVQPVYLQSPRRAARGFLPTSRTAPMIAQSLVFDRRLAGLGGSDANERSATPCVNGDHSMTEVLVNALVDLAAAPYRRSGRFAWHFARGKLTYDPLFVDILARGLIPTDAHIVDLGCGQGLLSSWLAAARAVFGHAAWPATWPEPPQVASFHGIEWMARDVDRAQRALPGSQFTCGDIREVAFGPATVVTIFDVLHYIDIPSQERVLERVRAALGGRDLLLLRIGDAEAGWRFQVSRWVDSVVTSIRGGRWQRLYCRSQTAWRTCLVELGFGVTAIPMSQGTPFANVLLVAQVMSDVASST